MKHLSLLVTALAFVGATAAAQEPAYKRDIPDDLAKRAKIDEPTAAVRAHKRLPKGHIDAVVLQNEKGRPVYLYTVRTDGKSGLDEVRINGLTGGVIAVHHRTESGSEMKKP